MNLESSPIYRQVQQMERIRARLAWLSPADRERARQYVAEGRSWEEALSEVRWAALRAPLREVQEMLLYQPPNLILPRHAPATGSRQSRRQRKAR